MKVTVEVAIFKQYLKNALILKRSTRGYIGVYYFMICSKCNQDKDISNFHKDKQKSDGYRHECKHCRTLTKGERVKNGYKRKYSPESIENRKQYLIKNKEKYLTYRENRRLKIKLTHKPKPRKIAMSAEEKRIAQCESSRRYRTKMDASKRAEAKANKAEWYKRNRESSLLRSKIWRTNNREHDAKTRKAYRENNKDKIRTDSTESKKKKYHSDILFKKKENIRKSIKKHLKTRGFFKIKRTHQILGCSYDNAMKHIESQFKPGMSWENNTIDGWHIDHIIPMASARTVDDVIRLWHYTNLQPLWAKENIKKGAKIL